MKRAARPERGIEVGRIDGGMHQPIVELIAIVVRAGM
jgi:hypothetical protein